MSSILSNYDAYAMQLCVSRTPHKKWSFPLRISPVKVTKSAVSCGFDHIYWRNPYWKTSFLCSGSATVMVLILPLASVKYNLIISNKNGIHQFSHKSPNDFRHIKILENYKILVNFQNWVELFSGSHSSSKKETFVNINIKLLKTKYYTFPIVHCLTRIRKFSSNIWPCCRCIRDVFRTQSYI